MMYSSSQFAVALMGSINIAWLKQLDVAFLPSSFTALMLVTMPQEKRERSPSMTADDGGEGSIAWQWGVNGYLVIMKPKGRYRVLICTGGQ